MEMTKHETLLRALLAVEREVPDIRGCALASRDGLPIVSTMPGTDASRLAAMAATVLALGARVAESTELGAYEETVIQGATGTFVTYGAGDAVLAVLAGPAANLGLVHLEARRAAEHVASVLANPTPAPTATPAPAHAAPAEALMASTVSAAGSASPAPPAAAPSGAALIIGGNGNGHGAAPRP
jgi:uncharacterized protein